MGSMDRPTWGERARGCLSTGAQEAPCLHAIQNQQADQGEDGGASHGLLLQSVVVRLIVESQETLRHHYCSSLQ